jgi:SAM-dependent methyltransferase
MQIWKSLWESYDLNNPADTPWETHTRDQKLFDIVSNHNFNTAIDVGCAVGTNADWLQQNGIKTVGIDISEKAISEAKKLNSKVEWICDDFVYDHVLFDRQFDLIFDRGCFHGYQYPESHFFAHKVSKLLSSNGYWISIIGAEKGDVIKFGPPRKTATEIVSVVEEHLEIVELSECHISLFNGNVAPAWCLISKKKS